MQFLWEWAAYYSSTISKHCRAVYCCLVYMHATPVEVTADACPLVVDQPRCYDLFQATTMGMCSYPEPGRVCVACGYDYRADDIFGGHCGVTRTF